MDGEMVGARRKLDCSNPAFCSSIVQRSALFPNLAQPHYMKKRNRVEKRGEVLSVAELHTAEEERKSENPGLSAEI